MARYPGLMLRILGAAHPAMGPGKARLVTLIDKTGSISAAAREMGMSYRRAWQLVEALNRSFTEPVVVTATGGRRGGGTIVTDFGREVVVAYRGMEDKASASIAADLRRFEKHLRRPLSKRAKKTT
jgi:molybdate transport system regulatory protein